MSLPLIRPIVWMSAGSQESFGENLAMAASISDSGQSFLGQTAESSLAGLISGASPQVPEPKWLPQKGLNFKIKRAWHNWKTRPRILKALAEKNPALQPTGAALDALIDVAAEFGDGDYAKQFASKYRGPREIFEQTVLEQQRWLRRASEGRVTNEEIIQIIPDETLQQMLAQLFREGWRVEFKRNNALNRSCGLWHGTVKWDRKSIWLILNLGHPCLTLLHELEHVRQRRLIDRHKESFDRELRRILFPIMRPPSEHDAASGSEEEGELETLLRKVFDFKTEDDIPDASIQWITTLLMEKGAFERELSAYSDICKSHPDMRESDLEEELQDGAGIIRRALESYKARIGFTDRMFAQLENVTIDSIIQRDPSRI